MSESLAVKYRPTSWEDVCEQSATLIILQQQLDSRDIKNAYLFCGGAGTGKTTCARIFANEINHNEGAPIELDAASNNSVDNVRDIILQAKTASIDSDYKIFIMDEVHALSNNAWQALLKLLEEPPMRTVFIMCTTNPEKIPKTILSRVQRFDFQRISTEGIVDRLKIILNREFKAFGCSYCNEKEWSNEVGAYVCKRNGAYADKEECIYGKSYEYDKDAINYIAKIADGGMRDAITMLDKCLAYSTELTLENVLKALGVAPYDRLMDFVNCFYYPDRGGAIEILDEVYMSGYDLKQFIHSLSLFVLDICKYGLTESFEHLTCPETATLKVFLKDHCEDEQNVDYLTSIIRLEKDIKWDTNPKARIEAWIITGGYSL